MALIALILLNPADGDAKKIKQTPKPQPVQTIVAANPLPEHKHTKDCDKTTAEPVQIICILDRSGSMSSVASDTIGGYNTFLTKQKEEPGKAQMSTSLSTMPQT